jgi:hypothetical protein
VGEAVGGAPFYGVRYHFGKHVTEGTPVQIRIWTGVVLNQISLAFRQP